MPDAVPAEAAKPVLLQTTPLMPFVREQLLATFEVHELWSAPDPEALLTRLAPVIRGLVGGSGKRRLDGGVFGALPALEIVASLGVGYDHIHAEAAKAHGVIVTHTPDVLNEEVADLAVGLLLATVRQLPQADRFVRAGQWLNGAMPLTASLRGRRVGILGLGRIGRAIARRLEAFGLPLAYHGRRRQEDVGYRYYPSLLDMARDVDVLLSIAPGGEATRGLVNAAVLQALGPQGILVNVGRGSVVDERALIEALANKTILSAGLDVFEDEPNVPPELIAMEHVVLLPHVGSASVHTRQAMGQLMVDNLLSWFAGKGPLTPVPETPWP